MVSADEFDKAVKAANGGNGFIAQRTYSAPDQETLEAYREQLYYGKWYVDCSTGGAQYGQGMYCAADYSGKLTDGIKAEMEHYAELGEKRLRTSLLPKSYTETFTLDPSAKILNYRDIGRITDSYEDKIKESIVDKYIKEKSLSDMEALYIKDRYFSMSDDSTHDDVMSWWNGKSTEEKDELSSVFRSDVGKLRETIYEKTSEFRQMDDGARAALLGYDAINASGHGASGSYTVILNRTKLIIKGE